MLEFTVDHSRRLVMVRAEGEVSGTLYLERLVGLLRTDPGLLAYDFRYDLTRYAGGTRHDDLAELARRLRAGFPDLPRGGLTVLVSPDAGFRYWAQLMEVQFPHRRFRWVASLAEADALLAARAAERAAPLSPEDSGHSC